MYIHAEERFFVNLRSRLQELLKQQHAEVARLEYTQQGLKASYTSSLRLQASYTPGASKYINSYVCMCACIYIYSRSF